MRERERERDEGSQNYNFPAAKFGVTGSGGSSIMCIDVVSVEEDRTKFFCPP